MRKTQLFFFTKLQCRFFDSRHFPHPDLLQLHKKKQLNKSKQGILLIIHVGRYHWYRRAMFATRPAVICDECNIGALTVKISKYFEHPFNNHVVVYLLLGFVGFLCLMFCPHYISAWWKGLFHLWQDGIHLWSRHSLFFKKIVAKIFSAFYKFCMERIYKICFSRICSAASENWGSR